MTLKEKIKKNKRNININTFISLALFFIIVITLISVFKEKQKIDNINTKIFNENDKKLLRRIEKLETNKIFFENNITIENLKNCEKGCEIAGRKFFSATNAFATGNFNIYKCLNYCFEELKK